MNESNDTNSAPKSIKCTWCGADLQPRNVEIRTVRHHYTQRDMDAPLPYCRDKRCAGYHQMSLEG